jgi:serine/threonine protein kinase
MELDYEGNIEIKQEIGKGNFGKVLLGIIKETGDKIAIKIIDKEKMNKCCSLDQTKRELNAMRQMDHLNIIKIYKIVDKENEYKIYMEYCEKGELYDHIVKKKYLDEDEAAYYYYQLINGLEYIHSKNIVHRDLKPENLLITKDRILKIIDFGLSNYHDIDNLLNTPCGSPSYASPEMVSGKQYNGTLVDIWCTGIILFAMLSGYLPFEANDNYTLFRKIIECKVNYPIDISKSAIDLMKKILIRDPSKRITIPEIKKHPFYLEGQKYFEAIHKKSQTKEKMKLNESEKILEQKSLPDLKKIYDKRSDKKKEGKKKKIYFKKKKIEPLKEIKDNTETSHKNIEEENKKFRKTICGNFKKNILCFNISIENSNNKKPFDGENKTFKKKGIFKKKNFLKTFYKTDENYSKLCYTENNNDVIKYMNPIKSPLNVNRKLSFEEKYYYNKFYKKNNGNSQMKNINYSPINTLLGPYKRPTLFERNSSLKKIGHYSTIKNSSLNKIVKVNNLNIYNSLTLTERNTVLDLKERMKTLPTNNNSINDSLLYKHKATNTSKLKEDKYVYEKKYLISKPSIKISDLNNKNDLNNFQTLNPSSTTKNYKFRKNFLFFPDMNQKVNEDKERYLYSNSKYLDTIGNTNHNFNSNILIQENDITPFYYNQKTIDNNRNNYIKKPIYKINKLQCYNKKNNQAKTISQDEKAINRLRKLQDQIFIKKRILNGNMSTKNNTINQSNSTLNTKKIDISNLMYNKNNTVIFNNQINQLNIFNNDHFNSINFFDNIKKNKIRKLKIKTPYKFKNEFKTIIINSNNCKKENNIYQSLNTERKVIKRKIFRPKNKTLTKDISLNKNRFKLKKESLEIIDKLKAKKNNNYLSLSNKNKIKFAPIFKKI